MTFESSEQTSHNAASTIVHGNSYVINVTSGDKSGTISFLNGVLSNGVLSSDEKTAAREEMNEEEIILVKPGIEPFFLISYKNVLN